MSDSRIEALLEALLNGTEPPGEPQSRIEAYLYALCEKGLGNSGGTQKTKLSEFENDLFYRNQQPFITLYPSDFKPVYALDDADNITDEIVGYYYKGSPSKKCLTGLDTFGFLVEVIEDGRILSAAFNIESDDVFMHCTGIEDIIPEIGTLIAFDEVPIIIASGVDMSNKFELIPGDSYIILIDDFALVEVINRMTLYEIDSKKIPIKYCDTNEIEAAIDALTAEVYNL